MEEKMKTEIEKFLLAQQAFDKSPNTIKAYRRTLYSFNKLVNKPISDINSNDVIKYISCPAKSAGRHRENGTLKLSTKKLELNRLSKFFEWNEIKNPVSKIRAGINSTKQKAKVTEILSIEEVSKLISGIFNPHERIIFVLLYKTGMREGELANLDISDIRESDQSLHIRDMPGNKTGERYIYLDSEGWDELQSWLKVRSTLKATDNSLIVTQRKTRISKLHIWQIVKKYGKLAGYEDLHPHTFRHCFTSHLAQNRILTKALQILRGDSDKSMVDLYTHLTGEQVREEYLKAMPKIL